MAFNNNSNEFFKIPEFENDIRDFFEIGDPLVIDRIISPDKMEARITAFSRWDSNEVAKDIKTRICNYMDKAIGDKYEYNITGIANLYLDMQENLKYSQINSFLIAFIIIFIMMFFVCRNIKLTFISIIPNLFPIVMILGIMGWSGIALDVSTIMIASITIGVAVDDTIHFIVWFKRNVLSGLDTKSALLKTYKDAGKPISITTLILFLSFFVFVFGSIKPTQAFGVLTAFSMVFALIGDLIVFPAVILIFKPKITD